MSTLDEFYGSDIMHDGDIVQEDGSGDVGIVDGLDNVKAALLNRLVTEPGSVIHRPDYGVGLKRFIGAPNTMASKQQLALRINDQFLRDERVESVLGVSVESEDLAPDRLKIIVRVKLRGYGDTKLEFIPFGEVP